MPITFTPPRGFPKAIHLNRNKRDILNKGRWGHKAKDLLLYWPLDDGLFDASASTGNQYCRMAFLVPAFGADGGKLIGGPSVAWAYDRRMGGYVLDAFRTANSVFSTINIAASLVNPGSNFTVSCWCYLRSTGLNGVCFCKGGGQYSFFQQVNAGFARFGYTTGGVFHFADSLNTFTLNKWNHYVGTYDGVNLRIYMNGKLDTTFASATAPDFNIGDSYRCGNSASGANQWDGRISRAMLFGRVLKPAEILDLYLTGFDDDESIGFPGPPIPAPPNPTPSPVGQNDFIGEDVYLLGRQQQVNSAVLTTTPVFQTNNSQWPSGGGATYIAFVKIARQDGQELFLPAGSSLVCKAGIGATPTANDGTWCTGIELAGTRLPITLYPGLGLPPPSAPPAYPNQQYFTVTLDPTAGAPISAMPQLEISVYGWPL